MLRWIGHTVTPSQYILAAIALVAPFVMCLFFSRGGSSRAAYGRAL